MEIQDRTFLVTGGGSGLGAATAGMLVAAGGRVVIADISADSGQVTADALGEQARFALVDVRDAQQMTAAAQLARDTFGGLHGAIACAGIAPAARVLGRDGPHPLDSFRRTVDINLVGTFNLVTQAAAVMADNDPDQDGGRGVLIATASVAAFDGQIGQAAYGASKAGVAGMTLPLARELARHGIRVMTIAPGIFKTPMLAGMPEKVQASLAEQIPFPPRLGEPSEYAALVRHIIENPMLNGEVIRLDGAIRMGAK